MQRYDSPYISDWFAIALRWLGLVALMLLPARVNGWVVALIILWALDNVALSVLAGLNIRLSHHRLAAVSLDVLFALALFALQGGLANPAWWVSLMPLIAAGLYFDLKGGILAAFILSAFQAGIIYGLLAYPRGWLLPVAITLFNLSMGILFGYLGHNLFVELRRRYQRRIAQEQEKIQVENERLRAIYDLSTTLTSTLSYKRVLESALEVATSALDPGRKEEMSSDLVGIVLLFSDGVLTVTSGRRLTNTDWRVRLPAAAGAIARALESGDPVLLNSVSNDPELRRILILHSCRSIYIYPLRIGFDVFGILVFAHPDENFFADEKREVLDILGQQTVIAIKNARLYEDLLLEKEHLAEVQEEARNKLARDLHDGPTQTVSAIAMRLNLVRMMLTKKPEAVPGELEKLEGMARRAAKELRHLLFTLRPLVLESQGLQAALEAMADKMREMYEQNVIVEVEPHLEEILEKNKQGVIFFIAEEAVNNARKHARADHIWVRLRDVGHDIALLEILDDGVGFDLQAVMGTYETRGSLGMINLRERSELVNGLLHIESKPGQGTRIQVFIPLTEEAADRLHHARQE